jgi:hypothetical protein
MAPMQAPTLAASRPAIAAAGPRGRGAAGWRPGGGPLGGRARGLNLWFHRKRDRDRPRADLRALLERVEAASPTDAVEVVADEFATLVGASAS